MKIIEISLSVDEKGSLILPKAILADMGLSPGDEVKIAYITGDDNSLNTYKEFLISRDGIEAIEDGDGSNKIYIPDELLDIAGIGQDSDVTIECERGEIKITVTNAVADDTTEEMRQLTGEIKW